MPSATAQMALIQATYRQAGLDLSQPSDRPLFFEAHGTGTPAGDPIEAEAIHMAFFGSDQTKLMNDGDTLLYAGSIKTVIGHTEGIARLAALLKASLALQEAVIPPNLLLRSG
ncbi:thiolase-like protein [Lipomyces doorenjongii]